MSEAISNRPAHKCLRKALRTGKKLTLRLLIFLCVLLTAVEVSSRSFWKIKGLSFFKCQKQIHWIFYPMLKSIEALPVQQDDDFYDVLLLGGSVLHEDFGSIALLLGVGLEGDKHKNVRIHNATFRAHSSLDNLYKYRHLSDKNFDLVLVYQGINEIRANNCPPSVFRRDYSHYSWYRTINAYERAATSRLLVFPYTLKFGWIQAMEKLGISRSIPTDQPPSDWIDYGNSVKTQDPFRDNLSSILALAEKKNEPVVLMSFAYYIPEQYPDVEDWWMPVEMWGKPDNVAKGIEIHNQNTNELLRLKPDILFVDQNRFLPKDGKHFRDACHLTEQGARAFANNFLREKYKQILKQDPNDSFAYRKLGDTFFSLKEYRNAIDCYEKSRRLEPNDASAYIGLGRANAAQGDIEGALLNFRQALEIQPYIGGSSNVLGQLLQLIMNCDSILSHHNGKNIVLLRPAAIHLGLGIAFRIISDNNESIRNIKEQLQHSSDNPNAQRKLGLLLKLREKLGEAIQHFQHAMKKVSTNAKLHYLMGEAMVLESKLDMLIEQCRQILQSKSGDVESTCFLSIADELKKTVFEFKSKYEELLKVKSTHTESEEGIVISVTESEYVLADAVDEFQQALAYEPNNHKVEYQLASAFDLQKNDEFAALHYKRTLTLEPDHAEALNSLGDLMLRQGKSDVALSHYNRALTAMSYDAELYYKMGEALRAEGKYYEAARCYRQALQIDLDHPGARYSLEIVRTLR